MAITSLAQSPALNTLSRYRGELAALLCLNAVYFFAYFQRVAVPGTIFDELQADFGLTAGAVTTLASIYLYIYGGMQPFVGMMTDRLGPFRVLLMGGALLTLGSLAFPLTGSLPLLYAARALVGLGSSLIFICVVKGVDFLFAPIFFPIMLAISQALGNGGGLAGTYPFERAVHAWGWRGALLGAGVLCALALVISAVVFIRQGYLTQGGSAVTPLVMGRILRNRYSWPMLIAGPLNFGLYFLVQATIGKKFLTDFLHLSPDTAAGFTFLMMLVTMIIGVVGASLTRVIGDRRKPLVVLSIGFTGLGVALLFLSLLFDRGAGWFLAAYLLLGFSATGSALGNALMKELNPPEAVGTAIGLLNGGCYIIVALITTMAGLVMDHYWTGVMVDGARIYPKEAYLAVFGICLAIAGVAFTASLCLRETRGVPVFTADQVKV